ncbi:hypothetical protein D1631_03085 [Chryseobacterium nematophagum]|uniref:2TM domain-containing protein n=1 Tax=Chryseobacterium nematophagum TaxID=2305228 RepID=A0A3M7TDN4_9FLAO|nr:2TM domain-containing protein [Chryseobacterium nematophagum]RNA60987.1 hypothetical protein D1631_03085 [Chryseobacterium nematophagum]
MNYNQAYKRVAQLKRFYKSLIWFGIVALIILFTDFFKKGIFNITEFNGSLILTIWAIILIIKSVKLFLFNSTWERKVLEHEMRKTKDPINF